jgi:16S rRNA (cytidine1402-2'-O)-methyltransferase
MNKSVLYIVATPIGNLEDITLRALRVLKEVDLIAAEDTRRSLKLLNHYGISKPMTSYWGERERTKADEIIGKMQAGLSVALISDAGTPGIADPGSVLIRRALEKGIRVVSVPGPSAVITALAQSGFPADQFIFAGFVPSKALQRQKLMHDLALEKRTLVLYDAPHRILKTVTEMAGILGERKAVVIRELTKMFEETFRGTLPEILESLLASRIAGEYVIIVEGRGEEKSFAMEDALAEARNLMAKGFGRKEAVARIAGDYGISKKELYDRSLEKE